MERESNEISGAYHLIHKQGGRAYQEDRYSYDELAPGVIWMAVYDGHGGEDVSELARTVLPQVLKESLRNLSSGENLDFSRANEIRQIIVRAFLQADRRIFDILQARYANTAGSIAGVISGSTVSGILRVNDKIFVVNLGDSGTAIVSKSGPLLITTPHKPTNAQERLRIERAGGWVDGSDTGGFYRPLLGPARVKSTLAVSRSLGDWMLEKPNTPNSLWDISLYPYTQRLSTTAEDCKAQWVISKEPDVFFLSTSNTNTPLLGLICTDGLTDLHPLARWASILSHPTPSAAPDPLSANEWNVSRFNEILNKHFLADNTTAILVPLGASTTCTPP
jgi:serine/threonine protein phosphatase PrpC